MSNAPVYPVETDLHLQILQEKLEIRKRKNVTGIVRLEKTVRVSEEYVDEDLESDKVSVERVTIGRYLDKAVATRQEGDTTIIPVMEEIMIISKQLVLKEEIRITRSRQQSHYYELVPLRTEEVRLTRLDPIDAEDVVASK